MQVSNYPTTTTTLTMTERRRKAGAGENVADAVPLPSGATNQPTESNPTPVDDLVSVSLSNRKKGKRREIKGREKRGRRVQVGRSPRCAAVSPYHPPSPSLRLHPSSPVPFRPTSGDPPAPHRRQPRPRGGVPIAGPPHLPPPSPSRAPPRGKITAQSRTRSKPRGRLRASVPPGSPRRRARRGMRGPSRRRIR
jgi:hypothetical protein